jgi:TrmH family RNA methyltransferase
VITNQEIKLIQSLDKKSERINSGFFVVEGVKNIEELLQSSFKIHKIYGLGDFFSLESQFIKISEKELSRISHLKTPNQALALVKTPTMGQPNLAISTIVLDGVNDPGNLGTIIRTADWFGIKQIVCSSNSVDVFSPKVVMSTMGSLFRVSIFYVDLIGFIKKSKLKSYAAVLKGEDCTKTNFDEQSIIVMGSESHGISMELIDVCSNKITIPGSGTTESLNLGVATGIVCYEYFKNSHYNFQ